MRARKAALGAETYVVVGVSVSVGSLEVLLWSLTGREGVRERREARGKGRRDDGPSRRAARFALEKDKQDRSAKNRARRIDRGRRLTLDHGDVGSESSRDSGHDLVNESLVASNPRTEVSA